MNLKNTSHWINQKEIAPHIAEVKKYPVLTPEEEKEILNEIKDGNLSRRDLLIKSNMRFVISVAKKFINQGLTLGDVIAEGNYGLIKAVERYDYQTQPVRFLSYAVWWIRQTITESLHKHSRTIRLPSNKINKIYESQNKELKDTAYDYTLSFPKICSFDVSIDDDGNTLHELVSDENVPLPDHKMDNLTVNIQSSLKKILSFLKQNEQFVLIKAFGLDGNEPWTLQDIADNMDLTKERVRQIKERALKELRNKSADLLRIVN